MHSYEHETTSSSAEEGSRDKNGSVGELILQAFKNLRATEQAMELESVRAKELLAQKNHLNPKNQLI